MDRLLLCGANSEVAVEEYDESASTVEKDESFTLFGHSIKLSNKERMMMNDTTEVRQQSAGTFLFKLLKIHRDKRPRKTLDLVGLMDERNRKRFNDNRVLMMPSFKAVDDKESPNYDCNETSSSSIDLELRIGSSATATNKKRSRISIHSSDNNHEILCGWPPLIKKQRLMLTGPPNRATSANTCTTMVNLPVGLPVVNYVMKDNSVLLSVEWKIKKKLTQSDVNGSSRLLIGLDMVSKHILPHINNNAEFDETLGTEVVVWDVDIGSEHTLTFKRWKSNSFVFVGGWKKDFVKRRNLKENDEIGLKWDDVNSRFQFTLLRRDSNNSEKIV